MSRNERSLLTLRTLVQFEVAQAGIAVAEAARHGDWAEWTLSGALRQSESAQQDLVEVATRVPLNLPWLELVRTSFRAQRARLDRARHELTAARQKLTAAQAELARLRTRETAVEWAIKAERANTRRQQQAVELVAVDDMWLQRMFRESV